MTTWNQAKAAIANAIISTDDRLNEHNVFWRDSGAAFGAYQVELSVVSSRALGTREIWRTNEDDTISLSVSQLIDATVQIKVEAERGGEDDALEIFQAITLALHFLDSNAALAAENISLISVPLNERIGKREDAGFVVPTYVIDAVFRLEIVREDAKKASFIEHVQGDLIEPEPGVEGEFSVSAAFDSPQVPPSSDWLSQVDWRIDPVNGSDLNIGNSTAPLKTWAEFKARTNNGVWKVSPTVTIASSIPEPIVGDWRFLQNQITGVSTALTIQGAEPIAFAAGTVSAYSALSTVAPGAVATITDSGAAFTSAHLGRRIRLTTGAQAGAVSWILKVISSTSVQVGTFTKDTSIAAVTPGVNDQYVIDSDLVSVTGCNIFVFGENTAQTVEIRSLRIGNSPPGTNFPFAGTLQISAHTGNAAIRHCEIACTYVNSRVASFVGNFFNARISTAVAGSMTLAGCSARSGLTITLRSIASLFGSPNIFVGVTGFQIFGELRSTTTFGIFDSSNATAALALEGTASLVTTSNVIGSGNTGYGLVVPAGCLVVYTTKPVITGNLGDTRIGGTVTPYSSIPTFNTAKACGIVST